MKFKNKTKYRILVYTLIFILLTIIPTTTALANSPTDASSAEAVAKWNVRMADKSQKSYYCICQNADTKKAACIHIRAIPSPIDNDEESSDSAAFNNDNIANCDNFKTSLINRATLDGKFLTSLDRTESTWAEDNLFQQEYENHYANILDLVKVESGNIAAREDVKFTQCAVVGSDSAQSCTEQVNTLVDQFNFPQNATVKPYPPTTPKLETQLPGLTLSTVSNEGVGMLNLPWIAEYVAALYKYGVTVASILAVVLIILQGAKIVMSGGGEQKAAAYKTIARVIIGLIIAWSSYAILYTINPNLVNLKTLQIQQIQPEVIEANAVAEKGNDNNERSPTIQGGTCLTKENGVAIKSLNLKNIELASIVSLPYLAPDAAEGLKKVDAAVTTYNAAQVANGGREIRLLITSVARTNMEQNLAWEKALKNAGGDASKVTGVSRPSCLSGHQSGHAIDITISGSRAASHMGEDTCGPSQYARCAWDVQPVEDLQLLSQIMTGAGWQRLCLEWWHYEYPQGFLKEYGCRTSKPGKCNGRCG